MSTRRATAAKTKVAAIEGLRFPGAEGWNKTFVGIRMADNTFYAGEFDNGMDFVPETDRITEAVYDGMRKHAINSGWTEVMTPDQIYAVCRARVGDEVVVAFPPPTCILF